TEGQIRTAYDPAPEKMMRIVEDAKRSDTGKIYILWLWANVSGGGNLISPPWSSQLKLDPDRNEFDCGNARVAGLIAACRIAEHSKDQKTLEKILPPTRAAMRARVKYELDYAEGGVVLPLGNRCIFARWHFLTPE